MLIAAVDQWDVTEHQQFFTRVGANEAFIVVHLLGDTVEGTPTGDTDGITETIRKTRHSLRTAFPALLVHQWVIHRLGVRLDEPELKTYRQLATDAASTSLEGIFTVTGATAASVNHRFEDFVGSAGDLIHAACASSILKELADAPSLVWMVGTCSVTYRPERVVSARSNALSGALDVLCGQRRAQDPARLVARQVIRNMGLSPVGEVTRDSLGARLTVAPGSGSAIASLRQRVHEVEAELDFMDPGAWPGVLAHTIDSLTLSGGGADGPLSPLADAILQVHRNKEEARIDYERDLRSGVLEHFESTPVCASLDDWCTGAAEELVRARDELQRISPSAERSRLNLAEHHQRLTKAVRWLPSGNALLTRGLLIVIMLTISAYALAPIAQLVGWVLDVPLPRLADDANLNAQRWARVTAASSGLLIGAWWTFKWRRAIRWRRRYARLAIDLLETRLVNEVISARSELVTNLIALLGSDNRPLSIRHWIATTRSAISELRLRAGLEDEATMELGTSDFTLSLPDQRDLKTLAATIEVDDQVEFRQRFLRTIAASLGSQRALIDDLESALTSAGRTELPLSLSAFTERDNRYLQKIGDVVDRDMTPVVDRSESQFKGLSVSRYLLSAPGLQSALASRGWTTTPEPRSLATSDPNFACSLWLLPFDQSLTSDPRPKPKRKPKPKPKPKPGES